MTEANPNSYPNANLYLSQELVALIKNEKMELGTGNVLSRRGIMHQASLARERVVVMNKSRILTK